MGNEVLVGQPDLLAHGNVFELIHNSGHFSTCTTYCSSLLLLVLEVALTGASVTDVML